MIIPKSVELWTELIIPVLLLKLKLTAGKFSLGLIFIALDFVAFKVYWQSSNFRLH